MRLDVKEVAMRWSLWLRIIGMFVCAVLGGSFGFQLGTFFVQNSSPTLVNPNLPLQLAIISSLLGLAFGVVLTPYVTLVPYRWFRAKVRQIPAQYLVASTIGLVVGLLIATLLALPLSQLPPPLGQILPLVSAVAFAFIGITIMVTRERDLIILFNLRRGREGSGEPEAGGYVLLDTSVVIDGRIADISKTGFIERTMLVPQFVLAEVQYLADSPDALKRNRGQRGLEILGRLQKESLAPIQISDMDVEGVREVDTKLVRLAKQLRCPLLTNDHKLNQVAILQGVRVWNINELANAVKSLVLPGENITVRIIQEGREAGQGLAYLDDGTMIVVEEGRRRLNEVLDVNVTRVLQTNAGRMIFAQIEEKPQPQRNVR
jgi:uncharacterized protein YacL